MIPARRILAAVDFSEPSRTALAFAARLAAHGHSGLDVLHAHDPLLAAAAAARGVDLVDDTRGELASFASSVGATVDDDHLHVVTGPAAATICDIAIRENADLIVVGAHGMSGTAHAVFGSVAESVVRRAAMPVLVVPPDWTPADRDHLDLRAMGPVVAATDLCTPSVDAAAAACRLATLLGTGVELVHVVPDLPVIARWKPHAEAAIAARVPQAHAQLLAIVKALRSKAPVQVRVETGRLEDRLAAAAAPTGDRHPILVLGRRADTSRSAAPGSTAYRVLRLAHVPVLVYVPEEGS